MDFFGKYKRPKLTRERWIPFLNGKRRLHSGGSSDRAFYSGWKAPDQARKEQYDFSPEEEVPDDFIDPTRSGSFDLADATQLGIAVDQKIENQAKKGISERAEKVPVKEEAPEKKE